MTTHFTAPLPPKPLAGDQHPAEGLSVVPLIRDKQKEIVAHNALNGAVKKGDVVRPRKCSVCNKGGCQGRRSGSGVHAHHYDYDKPLSVLWLCNRCHGKLHRYHNFYQTVKRLIKEIQ